MKPLHKVSKNLIPKFGIKEVVPEKLEFEKCSKLSLEDEKKTEEDQSEHLPVDILFMEVHHIDFLGIEDSLLNIQPC